MSQSRAVAGAPSDMAQHITACVKEFNEGLKRADRGAETVLVRRIDAQSATVKFEYDDEVVVLSYPVGADGIWFTVSPDWISGDLNACILAGFLGLNQILAALTSMIRKQHELAASGGLGGSDDDSSSSNNGGGGSLAASAAGLEASGLYGSSDGNFALSMEDLAELKLQVAQAQAVLGENRVTLVPELGSVKMVLDVYGLLEPTLADKLGLHKEEPVFVSFSYEKSSVPSVSCTQRVAPGFGVKNHLKSVFDHFMHMWHHDRDRLKKVGRPPAGLVPVGAEATASGAAATAGGNSNNAAPPVAAAAAPAPKRSWWQSLFGDGKKQATVVLSEAGVTSLMDMGFDAVACVSALVESRNDADVATMLLVNSRNRKYAASKKQLDAVMKLQAMGFSAALSAAALVRFKFSVEEAAEACGSRTEECWKFSVAAPVAKKVTVKAGGGREMDAEDHPYNQDNFIFALLSYLQERLGHYSSYCICCHAPHSCYNPDGGVVCSEALCVFQLEESPMEKLMSVHLCPFKDCCDLDLSTVGKEFMGMPLDTICKQYGLTGQQLLEMLLHRYLPTDQIKLMLENGLRSCNCKRLESVLNPALCARFEHRWKQLRELRGKESARIAPHVAYHGTNEMAVEGICKTGFLLNKLSSGSGDNGWFGCGIYFSQHVTTALSYSRCNQMLVCAVLMGKIYKCPGRMDGAQLQEGFDSHESPDGQEWVIYDETSILPVYVVHYG